MTPDRATAGFSLIEMLVSLVVLSLAAVLLAAGIGRIGLSLNLARQDDSRVETIATAQFVLRLRLANAEPVEDIQAGSGSLDFVGLDNRVDFIAEPADRAAPEALQYYRIARDPNGDLALFTVSTLDARVDFHNPATVGWVAQPLVSRTAGLEISYLGRSTYTPSLGPVWQDSWTRRSDLPMLVRIHVSFAQGDPRTWPDLVVHPRAAIPDPCPPEALSDNCRKAQAGDT